MIRTVKPPSDQRSANGALGPSASHDHYSGGKRFLAANPVSCLAEPGNDINATLRRLSRNPPHLPIFKVRRKGEVYLVLAQGVIPPQC